MKILVSNDDGVNSEGIWALARQLSNIAEVTIVAPDREQSAVGTAVNLRRPLRVQQIASRHPPVQAFSVEGTPSDSVIVGLAKIISGKVDLVVSGCNQGSNLGEDVLISGTVGAALSAYLRGFPAMAVSCKSTRWQKDYLGDVGRFITVLARRSLTPGLPGLFLNVNFPDLDFAEIKGVRLTRLAHKSHVNTVEEGRDARGSYYTLERESIEQQADEKSDMLANSQGYISVTPLDLFLDDRVPLHRLAKLVSGLLEEFKRSG